MSRQDSSSSSGTPQFRFVTGNVQSEARGHVMREHWKRRHRLNKEAKTQHHRRRSSRPLLPRVKNNSNENASSSAATSTSSDLQRDREGDFAEDREKPRGIPAQLLSGMSNALASSRPDPFQTCPVHLTSQHQKLLHHCASDDSRHCCWWEILLTESQGLVLMRL